MKTYYRRKFRWDRELIYKNDRELIYKNDKGIISYWGKDYDTGAWRESRFKTIEDMKSQSLWVDEIPVQEIALII